MQTKIKVKLIIEVSKTFGLENALNNLNLTLENYNSLILGISFGGKESGNPIKQFEHIAKKAHNNNIKVVCHSGEESDLNEIWDAINYIKPYRIGHCTSAIFDQKLLQYLKQSQIPLEICPTSNVIIRKYVDDIKLHPIRKFFDLGLNVNLNSDDPLIFDTSLNDEYINLVEHLNFTKDEILKLIENSKQSCFKN